MAEDSPELLRAAANKKLGQHFLFDPDILKRAALASGPVEGRDVLEVGPGPGGLTRALLDNGARKLVCVEMDDRFADALQTWPEATEGRLSVERGDAMQISLASLMERYELSAPIKIVANLPYNIGTPLFINWVLQSEQIGEMALMFQKEVAQRICAKPGSNHYGRLAVIAQAVTKPRMAFTLPPGAFKPPPKVASAVVVTERLPTGEAYPHLEALQTVTAAAFGQRRKMLRASLKPIMSETVSAEDLLNSAGIDPTRRAETLSQAEFRTLTSEWLKGQPSSSKA